MQRPVEPGLGRRLPWNLREACTDLLECERVVAEQVTRRLEAADGRVHALAVVILGRGLAVAHDVAGAHLDLEQLDLYVRRARDPEGRAERKVTARYERSTAGTSRLAPVAQG